MDSQSWWGGRRETRQLLFCVPGVVREMLGGVEVERRLLGEVVSGLLGGGVPGQRMPWPEQREQRAARASRLGRQAGLVGAQPALLVSAFVS